MTKKEIEKMLDTGCANDYMLAYLHKACEICKVSNEEMEDLRQGFLTALDMYTASEVIEYFYDYGR